MSVMTESPAAATVDDVPACGWKPSPRLSPRLTPGHGRREAPACLIRVWCGRVHQHVGVWNGTPGSLPGSSTGATDRLERDCG